MYYAKGAPSFFRHLVTAYLAVARDWLTGGFGWRNDHPLGNAVLIAFEVR